MMKSPSYGLRLTGVILFPTYALKTVVLFSLEIAVSVLAEQISNILTISMSLFNWPLEP